DSDRTFHESSFVTVLCQHARPGGYFDRANASGFRIAAVAMLSHPGGTIPKDAGSRRPRDVPPGEDRDDRPGKRPDSSGSKRRDRDCSGRLDQIPLAVERPGDGILDFVFGDERDTIDPRP